MISLGRARRAVPPPEAAEVALLRSRIEEADALLLGGLAEHRKDLKVANLLLDVRNALGWVGRG